MKALLRRALLKMARLLDSPPAASHALTDPFFDCLTRLHYQPSHIVDVGANSGGWTRTALKYFPDCHYSLFEPQAGLLAAQADLAALPNVHLHPLGAGAVNGVMKLATHERSDSFSFALTEEQAAAANRPQIEAQVVALDDFLPRQGLPPPDILKIDAEGWDLEVLKGASNTADAANIVLLEAAVLCKGFQNRVETVIAEMHRRSFILFDITELNRNTTQNALWLLELAFVKQNGPLDTAVHSYCPPPKLQRRRLLHIGP